MLNPAIFLFSLLCCLILAVRGVAPLQQLTEFTLSPNETIRINLNDYFNGYKLKVSLENNTFTNASISEPFVLRHDITFNYNMKVFRADDEDPYFYTLDDKNTFRLYAKQNDHPTNTTIGNPLQFTSPTGSLACQQVAKVLDASSPNIIYFIIDCDWISPTQANLSSFQVVQYNLSETAPAAILTLVAPNQQFNSNFTTFQCNRTLLMNVTVLYRFCPISVNPQSGPWSVEDDLAYYSQIEIYNFIAPKINFLWTIRPEEMDLDQVKIESLLFWGQHLIIVDYSYGIYFIRNDNFVFSLYNSHESYSSTNKLLDYKFEVDDNFPESELILLLETDGYLSELTIAWNQTISVWNYNLNFDSIAANAKILNDYVAVNAYWASNQTNRFLKIYKRDYPTILFDIQNSIIVGEPGSVSTLPPASDFYRNQNKIFLLQTTATQSSLKICEIQSLFLEITATVNVSSFTQVPPYTINISSMAEDDGSPEFSYLVTIPVAVMPLSEPTMYPNKQLNLSYTATEKDISYPLSGTCKGPAMLYGWLVQPTRFELQNLTIKETSNFKATGPIQDSTHILSDLSNNTFIFFAWNSNITQDVKTLSIVWQQCETCNVSLIECYFRKNLLGNIVYDKCTLISNLIGNVRLNTLLVQGSYAYVTFKEDPQDLNVFELSTLNQVADGFTRNCSRIDLRPSSKEHIYCFCYSIEGDITIMKINGASIVTLTGFDSMTKNTTRFIDTSLLDDGIIVYRNHTHLFIDLLAKKDESMNILTTMHASSLQVLDDSSNGSLKIYTIRLDSGNKLVVINTGNNSITEFCLQNPYRIRYLRQYPIYDFVLLKEQPLFISGNSFFFVTANSSDHQYQYYLVYDPSKDSGSVLLYFDSIVQVGDGFENRNIWIPHSEDPLIVDLTKEGILINLIEKNPVVTGSFDLGLPSSATSPYISASFAIRCVSFGYHLRKAPYYHEGSYTVSTTLELQDRKIYLQKINNTQTEFDFSAPEVQLQPITADLFSGPIMGYNLYCSSTSNDCPYVLKDYLNKNYAYTTYLNSTKVYGDPLKIRAINDSWVVLLSQYRISFISIPDGMEEISSYDLRTFSLKCEQFYEAKEINSIMVVCQKGTLSVNFLVFSLNNRSIKKDTPIIPKLVELPVGVRFWKINRMVVFDDLVLVLARQDSNYNTNSIDIFRISKNWFSYKFCLVEQIRLNKYREAGDINIDHIAAQRFPSLDGDNNTFHLQITVQQSKAVLNLILNITLKGTRYSRCAIPGNPDDVYELSVWELKTLDIPNKIMQYEAYEQKAITNPYNSTTTITYVNIANFSLNSMNQRLADCYYLIGTSRHVYMIDTSLNFTNSDAISSRSAITTIYRQYMRCQNIYSERPMFVGNFLLVYCLSKGDTPTTYLMLYKNGSNCKISSYDPGVVECWPVQMFEMGYNAPVVSMSSYVKNESSRIDKVKMVPKQHLLITSYLDQFSDYDLSDDLTLILRDDYFRDREHKILETRTQLILEGENFDRNTGGRAILTVYNYVRPEEVDDYYDILGLILYGFFFGCAIVVVYLVSKVVKRAIDESKKDSNKDMYSFLGKSPAKQAGKKTRQFEFA